MRRSVFESSGVERLNPPTVFSATAHTVKLCTGGSAIYGSGKLHSGLCDDCCKFAPRS